MMDYVVIEGAMTKRSDCTCCERDGDQFSSLQQHESASYEPQPHFEEDTNARLSIEGTNGNSLLRDRVKGCEG